MVAIQTDIYSLLGLAFGCLAGGVIITLLITRKLSKRDLPDRREEDQEIFLIFSRLSHQLKTVGEVIRGHMHGFSEDLPKDSERWRVARIALAEEATEINTLTERLDLVVRLGLSGQPLVMEPVNVPRLVEDLMVDLGPSADAKGIILGGIVNSNGGEIPYISADMLALREVFSNLMENAVKHNGSGIEVTAEVKHQNANLVVRISDNGHGIPPEKMSAIFEKGGNDYRPAALKGTGMGLYICKLLVELHNGNIAVKNLEPHGTEFQVTLPVRRA